MLVVNDAELRKRLERLREQLSQTEQGEQISKQIVTSIAIRN